VALYLTIAEQFEAAIILANAGMGTHSAVHVRSMVEALITMNLLALEPDYVDQIRFDKLKGECTLYTRLLSNHDLPQDNRQSFEASLLVSTEAFDALKTKGIKRRNTSEDFGPSGLSQLAAPYAILCGFSHNDLAVLALRHQGDDGMTFRAPVHEKVMQSIFSVAIQIMVTATLPLFDIAKFPDGHFESLFQKINNIWGAYMSDNSRVVNLR
jgi:hypothetical protein